MNQIRKTIKEDIPALKEVLNSIELFPSEMLDDMISPFFNDSESEQYWFTKVENNKPIAFAYCAQEQLTDGTFNLYAIGVLNSLQGKGIGKELMTFVENFLKKAGKRILIVDTSSTEDFKQTRQFYEKLSYRKEATIKDFGLKEVIK